MDGRNYTNFNLYVGNRDTLSLAEAVAEHFGLPTDTSKSKILNAILDPALLALLQQTPKDGEAEVTITVRLAA